MHGNGKARGMLMAAQQIDLHGCMQTDAASMLSTGHDSERGISADYKCAPDYPDCVCMPDSCNMPNSVRQISACCKIQAIMHHPDLQQASVSDLDIGGVHQPGQIDRSSLATGTGALGGYMLRSLLCISLPIQAFGSLANHHHSSLIPV